MIRGHETLTSRRYGISPVAAAFALNALVALVVVVGVALHLSARRHSEVQAANERVADAVRMQVATIGEQHRNLEYVLSQLGMRLNEAMALQGGHDTDLHAQLRLFQNLVPGTRDLLLVDGEGQVLAASGAPDGRTALSNHCGVFAQEQPAIEAAGLWAMPTTAADERCPPPGTAVMVFKSAAFTGLHSASLWLLVSGDRFQQQLQERLSALVPSSRFRVLIDGDTPLVEGQLGGHGGNALVANFPPAFDGSEQPDQQAGHTWSDPVGGELWSGVAQRVPGMALHVQAIYPVDAAIQGTWRPYLRLWLLATAVFLLAWGLGSMQLLRLVRRYQHTLLRNEDRFDLSLDYAQVCVWEWDLASKRVFWSRQMTAMLGAHKPVVEGTENTFLDRIHKHDRERVRAELQRCIDGGGFYSFEFRLVRVDHQIRWVHSYGNAVRDKNGKALRVFGIMQDATERIQATRQLAEVAQHTQAILDNVVDGIITIDHFGVIGSFNPAATRIFGYSAEEAIGQPSRMLLPEGFRRGHDNYIAHQMVQTPDAKQVVGVGRELLAQHRDGHTFPIHLAVSEVRRDGQPTYIGLVRDITQQRQAEADIAHLAFYEQLTNLPNRRLLLDRLQRALHGSERSRNMGALVMLDLDDFKTLNDTWGHEAGDQLLVELAQRLTGAVREGDTVARLGGDEFVLLLENLATDRATAAAHTEAVMKKVLALFDKPFHPQQREYMTTASLGVALFGDAGRTSTDTVMGQADMAMYQAKGAGRNNYRFFDAELQIALTARATLEMDLRQGIANNEFRLHFQPQVDATGQVQGVEALLRWQHPTRGNVSPAQFIPLAEQSGFILELGQWVLTTACEKLAAWRHDPDLSPLRIAVNVSAKQFRSPRFVRSVIDTLTATGADPSRLELELTESVLADDVESLVEKMTTLRAHGVLFSLDDFGTGYSSLNYLKRLPLDQLKIDQSFVRDLMTDPNDAAIVCAVLTLGSSLGLQVIAEGVETDAQKDFLRRHGCAQFQGYLFSRPLAEEALATFLEARRPVGQAA
ncbi:putative bifunctional diguanylate cyclase/phosphodiesterase [Hydrogenophaga atypica]|uniref:Bifunctional diguanylate cyclase/phosphodiesterase n=1 Tax=Hydrogenophaga atypica TaxID=249409 RepID=A0ABW2QM50_9BURK